MKRSECVNCGVTLNAATNVSGNKQEEPQPGTITVCSECGEIMEFTIDLSLAHIDDETLETIKRETPSQYEHLMKASQAFKNASESERQRMLDEAKAQGKTTIDKSIPDHVKLKLKEMEWDAGLPEGALVSSVEQLIGALPGDVQIVPIGVDLMPESKYLSEEVVEDDDDDDDDDYNWTQEDLDLIFGEDED